MAHSASANTWDLLKNDPVRYIYEPVRRGTGADEAEWEKSLPKNIAMGLEEKEGGTGILPVSSSSSKESRRDAYSPFLERRKFWNTSTLTSHALPTAIWRETIARHQRCHELRKKLRAGAFKDPADLVTLNLDIRQFVQDIIATPRQILRWPCGKRYSIHKGRWQDRNDHSYIGGRLV